MNDRTHTSHRLRRTAAVVVAGIAALAVSGTASASPVGSVGVAPETAGIVENGINATITVRAPRSGQIATGEVIELNP